VPLPVPAAGDTVMKAALLIAVHAQVDADAVTGIVPVVPTAPTDVVTEPTVIVQAAGVDDAAGVASLLEHAAAASAIVADTAKASRSRWYLISRIF
jgi:hypothetical protein